MEIRVSLSGEDPFHAPLRDVAGVGLLRGEFILRSRGEHITIPGARTALQDYVRRTCLAFEDRPVWYRLSDLWSDEIAVLDGAGGYSREQNPIIGLRGIERLLENPDAMDLELGAIVEVAQEQRNLHLLAPFVHDADEFARFVDHSRRRRWPNRLGAMVEVPAAVIDAGKLAVAGASNLLVGLNDLTSLMLGRERGSAELKLHRAVWWAVEHVRDSVPAGVEWGIGGSLSSALLAAARKASAIYATVHYAELPALAGLDASALPDLEHVRAVKDKTRAAKRARS